MIMMMIIIKVMCTSTATSDHKNNSYYIPWKIVLGFIWLPYKEIKCVSDFISTNMNFSYEVPGFILLQAYPFTESLLGGVTNFE
jgi:hypothetical protein